MGKKSKFGLGLALGAVIGSITALFLSPGSGEENREWVKGKLEEVRDFTKDKDIEQIAEEVYGMASEEGKVLLEKAQKEFGAKMKEIRETMEDMDKDDYMALVKEVLGRLSKEKEATQKRLSQLSDYFMKKRESEEM
ncbi:YtxH domain-containing protein [Candidatus Woesebacteria bacterium]|nr:YtxH domain-containing protein [Candidatus Woesebacteria bacterium]